MVHATCIGAKTFAIRAREYDAKGRDIVPLWERDYRTYLADRRAFTADLRATRENVAFYETAVDGIPISEKLETFAADNHMASCAPPRDLTR